MNGDPLDHETLRIMGGLQTAVSVLNRQVDSLSVDVKQINLACKSFEMYDKLPERIDRIERVTEEYIAGKSEREKDSERIRFLAKRYDAGMIAVAVINTLVLVFVWLVQRGIIKVSL
jgi:hypothetical protein